LLCGAMKGRDRERALDLLKQLVALLPVLPLPQPAGEAYGAIRADLERRGEVIGNNDLWIAAHALPDGLILATNNKREFARISGLQLADWVGGG
jgi:tRNA(fMet)-specific endonuclease VapC